MSFEFAIQDDPPTSGFDIGQLLLIDPTTGQVSEKQTRGKCYMVYVESVILLDQLLAAKFSRSAGCYKLPNGSTTKFDGKTGLIKLVFPGLIIQQSLDDAIESLLTAMRIELPRIEPHLFEEDAGIIDFRSAIRVTS